LSLIDGLVAVVHRALGLRVQRNMFLIWNFVAEILAQQSEFCRCGGKFIVPVPKSSSRDACACAAARIVHYFQVEAIRLEIVAIE
jgi:hypothetical protein